MTSQDKKTVFISYSHADKDFVNLLAGMLLNFDLQIWKDSKDIPIGGNILKSVYEGIKTTPHFCCIISSWSIKSAWVEEELSYAKVRQLEDRKLEIVPVLIDVVEIPDFLKAYRCAHLENRDLSLKNSEFILVLQAFGVDIKSDAPQIITGPERRLLLQSCIDLRERIIRLREEVVKFKQRYENYEETKLVREKVLVRDEGTSRTGIGSWNKRKKLIPNPAYSRYTIRESRDKAAYALRSLREVVFYVVAAIKQVQQAGKAAKLDFSSRDNTLWTPLYYSLDHASAICRTISNKLGSEVNEEREAYEDSEYYEDVEDVKAEVSKGLWWTNEKLERWIKLMPRIEASLEGVIAMLDYWRRFDSGK